MRGAIGVALILAGAALLLVPAATSLAFGESVRLLDPSTQGMYALHAAICGLIGIGMVVVGARKDRG
jgi:hypothetical protein